MKILLNGIVSLLKTCKKIDSNSLFKQWIKMRMKASLSKNYSHHTLCLLLDAGQFSSGRSNQIIECKDNHGTSIFNDKDGSPANLWAKILQSNNISFFSQRIFVQCLISLIHCDSLGLGVFAWSSESQVLSFYKKLGQFILKNDTIWVLFSWMSFLRSMMCMERSTVSLRTSLPFLSIIVISLFEPPADCLCIDLFCVLI